MKEDKYIVVTWSDNSQELMEQEWFGECLLVNDDVGLEMYGSSAYFVPENRYNELRQREVYVCPICGSDDVEGEHWINLNTNQIGDITSNDECYCNNCEQKISYVETVSKEDHIKHYINNNV